MGYFKKVKHTASDSNQKFWIYEPTVQRGKGVVYVKGKNKSICYFKEKIKMPKKFKTKSSSWKQYHSRWKYYNNLQFKIANSLSSKHPFGRNPNTKKYYKSAQDFAKALSNAEKNDQSL